MTEGRLMEGLYTYGLANIRVVLCYNSRFEDYKGLYGIMTDLILKKERS